MRKIKITGPIGHSGKVNGVYFTAPSSIIVKNNDELKEAKKELETFGFTYDVDNMGTTHHVDADTKKNDEKKEEKQTTEKKDDNKKNKKDSK